LPSRGSPTGIDADLGLELRDEGVGDLSTTMMRSVDMQIWPEFMNAPKIAAFTASSRSASSSTISGALPPSSSSTGLRCCAARFGDDPADRGRTGEVDAAHRRMIDQRADDLGRHRTAHW
jgi:hypothetical protein